MEPEIESFLKKVEEEKASIIAEVEASTEPVGPRLLNRTSEYNYAVWSLISSRILAFTPDRRLVKYDNPAKA